MIVKKYFMDCKNAEKFNFYRKTSYVLTSNKGWGRAGIKFLQTNDISNADFVIKLVCLQCIKSHCGKDFLGLSCTNYSDTPVTCYINLYRWMNGSVHSKLNLEDYRTYVINHEVGHALGLDHDGCSGKGKPASNMMQHTVGIGECIPSPWPIDTDIEKLKLKLKI